tara:strand:+ start:675 stop:1829 length:1155 start_codon:yes stop_codon:yes gene_type:complete
MAQQLPNLSQLRVADDTGIKLFEYLVEKGANKGKCKRHVDDKWEEGKPDGTQPAKPDAYAHAHGWAATMTERRKAWDKKMEKYLDDERDYQKYEVDCGVDGYFMYRDVDDAADVSTLVYDYLAKPLQVDIKKKGVVEEVVTLQTLNRTIPRVPEGTYDKARKADFEATNPNWVKDHFDKACDRGGGLGTISWDGYGRELAGATDWYYLHDVQGRDAEGKEERKTGHLFLQLFDSENMKRGKHMPTAGRLAGRYMYIGLVCTQGGSVLAKHLMEIAYAASRALGCTGILLATMTNSAGFYYSQGFQFIDKVTGQEIDADRYIVEEEKNGELKTMLKTNYDPDNPNPDNPGGQKRNADEAGWVPAARRAMRMMRFRHTDARLSYFS